MRAGTGYDHFFGTDEWLSILLKKWLADHCAERYFFDVGANVGQTLLKVKSIDPAVKYIGFEPNPNCVSYLLELLSLNRFGIATIYPVGISDHNGIMDLQLYSDNITDTSASLVPEFRGAPIGIIKVPVCKLEVLGLDEGVKAGIIKIDVEGGELAVLNGLIESLMRDRPLVICEVLPVYHKGNIGRLTRQRELESLLESLNYSIALVNEKGSLELKEQFDVHTDVMRVNYVFYPSERDIIRTQNGE